MTGTTSDRYPLQLLPRAFAVCRLPPDADVPLWATRRDVPFTCVMRTTEELSIVCPEDVVGSGQDPIERGWRAFRLAGKVPFGTTGVISGITAPLAAAQIGVFVLSTYDTDYLMVKNKDVVRATHAWQMAGFRVD